MRRYFGMRGSAWTAWRFCAAAVFFDGQYRQGLDQLKFGNEGARQKGRAALPQMTDAQMRAFVTESVRILRPSGHLFLWLDKYALFEGSWQRWLPELMPARLVDGLIWDKLRPGMGRRTRYRIEALAVIQKGPCRAKGIWTDHSLEDLWPEKADRERHAHAKPVALIKRLIETVTRRGDLVVDPAAGAYGVFEACLATGRNFCGCDLADDGWRRAGESPLVRERPHKQGGRHGRVLPA